MKLQPMTKYTLLSILLSVSITIRISGQTDSVKIMDPIQTDRPDHSETPFLVPKGYFQMEHGFSIEDTDPDQAGFVYTYPSSLWKYGVNDNFELRLITEYITRTAPEPDLNGFLPIAVGFKTKLAEQHGILPKISFLGHLTFPGIVTEDFEITYFAPDLRLAFSHGISDFFSVSYNVGAEWEGENAEPDFIYSLSTAFSLTNRLGLYIEGYGSTPQREDDTMELRADAGLTYLIGNDLLLDISAGKGITDEATEEYVAFGISYRFRL